MIKIKHLAAALSDFYEKEILCQMTGLHKWLGYTGIFLLGNKIEDIIKDLCNHPFIKLADVIHGDEIDIRKLYDAASKAIDKCKTVEIANIKFDVEALDLLVKYIENISNVRVK